MENDKNRTGAKLVDGPVGKTLAQLTWPMVFGLLGMVAFNLVDALRIDESFSLELYVLVLTDSCGIMYPVAK